ncbi:unnamed protein product [Rotaria sordida]|uniref:Uncharacterized protein n=1 Tax=Rotaria sordida TaxID=392033 RepID=A0A814VPF9_9BILA|nr:unnamed protein product [Rotaria sordida]
MKHKFGWTFGLFFLFVYIPNFIYTFDCYYCANCLNTQRGVRITARPEDWCYKIVWQSGRGNQQIVSRGASSDCRQDNYNDQSMAIPGVFSGVARYCCRKHLCNSTPPRVHYSFLFIVFFLLLFNFFECLFFGSEQYWIRIDYF